MGRWGKRENESEGEEEEGVDGSGGGDGEDDEGDLVHAGVAPVAIVEAGPPKDEQANYQPYQGEGQQCSGIARQFLEPIQAQGQGQGRDDGQRCQVQSEEMSVAKLE